jgi:hypothetical protein
MITFEEPKFCKYCGRKLKAEITKCGFDVFTGKPKWYRRLVCPKAKSYFSYSLHSEYMPEEIEAPDANRH